MRQRDHATTVVLAPVSVVENSSHMSHKVSTFIVSTMLSPDQSQVGGVVSSRVRRVIRRKAQAPEEEVEHPRDREAYSSLSARKMNVPGDSPRGRTRSSTRSMLNIESNEDVHVSHIYFSLS